MKYSRITACFCSALLLLAACDNNAPPETPRNSENAVETTRESAPVTPPQPMSRANPALAGAGFVPPEPEKKTVFQCGDKVVFFDLYADGKANMRIANVSYAMEQVIAASGARYQNLGDESTVLWNKGNTARVTIDGTDLPDCVENPEAGKKQKPFTARGNEPAWHISLSEGMLVIALGYDGDSVSVPVVLDTRGDDGVRVVTAQDSGYAVEMRVEDKPCTDSMSGEKFARTVELTVNDTLYRGCGQSLVREIEWRLEDMDKKGIIDRSHLTLNFGLEGMMYGYAGCNNFSGQYTLEGESLMIGENIAMTMRACMAEALTMQEHRYLEMLPKMTRVTLDDTGAMILSAEDGTTLLFRHNE